MWPMLCIVSCGRGFLDTRTKPSVDVREGGTARTSSSDEALSRGPPVGQLPSPHSRPLLPCGVVDRHHIVVSPATCGEEQWYLAADSRRGRVHEGLWLVEIRRQWCRLQPGRGMVGSGDVCG